MKEGDLVECVNAKWRSSSVTMPFDPPKKGERYTVEKVLPGTDLITLIECPVYEIQGKKKVIKHWGGFRFRVVDLEKEGPRK